jgi:cyclophilin family peptidyl-prolyl cis-trans isomerase
MKGSVKMTSIIRPNQFLIVLFSFFFLITGCNATEPKAPEKSEKSEKATESQPIEAIKSGEKMSANPMIKLETSKGTMMIELDAEKAPLSSANFVKYVTEGFYDGLIFHRVIPNFMVQGGGMNPDMSEKGNKTPIKNEANNGLKNDRGTLAMARTNDPHSATSQFFINLKNNDFLNHTSETPAGWGYAVFGKVSDGLDVIDEIAKVKTGNHGGHGDVPLEPVLIIKATVEK